MESRCFARRGYARNNWIEIKQGASPLRPAYVSPRATQQLCHVVGVMACQISSSIAIISFIILPQAFCRLDSDGAVVE